MDQVALAINPAGDKLYVANYSSGSVVIVAVPGTRASSTESILADGSFSGAAGLAVSPDGASLFVAETDFVLAVTLDRSTFQLQAITGSFGLSLSPDGAKLYVTQAQEVSTTTTVVNAQTFLSMPETISINGASSTIGQFIGP